MATPKKTEADIKDFLVVPATTEIIEHDGHMQRIKSRTISRDKRKAKYKDSVAGPGHLCEKHQSESRIRVSNEPSIPPVFRPCLETKPLLMRILAR